MAPTIAVSTGRRGGFVRVSSTGPGERLRRRRRHFFVGRSYLVVRSQMNSSCSDMRSVLNRRDAVLPAVEVMDSLSCSHGNNTSWVSPGALVDCKEYWFPLEKSSCLSEEVKRTGEKIGAYSRWLIAD